RRNVRYTAHAGQFKPLHGTASGKAMLASLGDRDRYLMISRLNLTALTPNTITDPAALEEVVAAGKSRGWHCSIGENEPETSAVAVTIRSAGEVYILVVAGPTQRVEPQIERVGLELK